MNEKLLCIVTPEARTYYKATCVAQEFLDKDNNLVHKIGNIPDGEITEITTTTATIKHFDQGKLHGKLEVLNLADHSVTFSEEYHHGQLLQVTQHVPLPAVLKTQAESSPTTEENTPTAQQTPSYNGTIMKTTKDSRAFYVDGKQIAQETLSAKGASLELLGKIPDGPVKEFTENGLLKTEANYTNNKLHGEFICYNEAGQILSKETYQQGILNGPAEYNSYSRHNVFHTQCTYANAQLDGALVITQKDGTVRERAQYVKGHLTGEHTTYYANGNVEMQEHITDGKVAGERKLFFPTAELWYTETYINGRLEGERKEFFKDGKIRLTEFYSDGMLNGQRNIYDNTGELIVCEEYHWGNIIHNTEYRPL